MNPLPQKVGILTHLRIGKAKPFSREKLSAIHKIPTTESRFVNELGISEDEQADLRHHGGYLKAVHQMSTETYERLNAHFGINLPIGALGENLTVQAPNFNMNETNVCIGDVYHFGNFNCTDAVKLQVVQPRLPCYKINDVINKPHAKHAALWLSTNGISGWYYKVIQTGNLQAGMEVFLAARPYPFANLQALWQLINQQSNLDNDTLTMWLNIDCLATSWKENLAKKAR
ncbi:MOSC domain-containing protein [Moraxella macacae 0408225]|uniref:MOSC domain-containing protein n=1 Tax=Moraxella macacae 0408225 TaxID=1230338 RepID=L2F7H1_9GAMM|nr:MOSC domain-containing protein [Moraxella macacae]ELA08408.1 MOSC domain-containing protein [Moraxella macacae 0408225]